MTDRKFTQITEECITTDLQQMTAARYFNEENGYHILIVPAVKWISSPTDKFVGHYRRYFNNRPISLFSSTDFLIKKMRHYLLDLLGWYFNSRILRKQSQDQGQVGRFDQLVPCLRKIETIVHPPIGMSLFAAVKRASK